MPTARKRRSLSQAKEKLTLKHKEQKDRLRKCRRFLLALNPNISEDEILASIDYNKILSGTNCEIRQLEEEVRELEAEGSQKKRATFSGFSSRHVSSTPAFNENDADQDGNKSDMTSSDSGDSGDEGTDSESISREEYLSEIKHLEQSALYVAIQGLGPRNQSSGNDNSSLDDKIGGRDDEATGLNHVVYRGRSFHRDKCYHFEIDGSTVIVGITGFYSRAEAKCVLVMPFSATFLGMSEEGVDYIPSFEPSSHVQIQQDFPPLKLERFGKATHDIQKIPDLVYKPQVKGECYHFAYFYNHKRERCRRRTDIIHTVDLFSGAGVMSQGLHEAGFDTICAVEKDAKAAQAFRLNFHNCQVENTDVRTWLNQSNNAKIGRFEHMHGSPPCQGFSGANRNGGKNDKANNDLSLTYVEAVEKHRPLVATFENVTGMWKRKGRHYLKNILVGFMKLGYQVRCCQLIASDFGDAQARPRLVIFAAKRCVYLPDRPQPTHGLGSSMHVVTVKDAMHEMSATPEVSDSNCASSVSMGERAQLVADAPAPTIRASATPPLHYDRNRPITIHEMKALFSLPRDYKLVGSPRDQRRQLGNSVPVCLAAAVGRAVAVVLQYRYVGEEGGDDAEA